MLAKAAAYKIATTRILNDKERLMRGYPEQISIKQYDTLAISCEYMDDDGMPIALDAVSIYADMQSMAGVVVDRLAVTVVDNELGRFVLTPTKDSFDTGTYKIDLLFESALTRQRVSSETFMLTITSAVTAPRPPLIPILGG